MKKIIINENPWQVRIAIITDGKLQNIYFSAPTHEVLERAYFKGLVTKVLPGIQTAFIEFGQQKAGFLHISEIDRELALQKLSSQLEEDDEDEPKIEKKVTQKRDISKILKENEPILVQVSKEPVYEKGAKLTTCFTLPGRFIVLMPNIPRIGVSKKIEDREERTRLKTIIRTHLPEGMGAIIRTTSENRLEKDLIQDLNYLVQEWHAIEKKFATAKTADKIHEDLPLTLQIVRDHLDNDVEAIIIDSKQGQQELYKFAKQIAPEFAHVIQLYEDHINIFSSYGIEKQIEQALKKKVSLRSGGSIIIESTEAMTVIDVNTGRFIGKTNLEDTILKTNLEAAEEVVQQLKLRNIGGLIVIDFIDMGIVSNRQKVFSFFEKVLKERDKFQSVVLKISEFGLVQMTRKRSGKTLIQQLTTNCPTCHGSGFIKSYQTESYEILRALKDEISTLSEGKKIEVHINPHIFNYITSIEYDAVLKLEKTYNIKITFLSSKELPVDKYKIEKKS
ncbi:MAG TPA: Rne/Rng family ribonuclease [Candidatus Babeliales bacterium]|nr:Rne/Rng family ribonuclease [Candidatus Babeliales bacterium]